MFNRFTCFPVNLLQLNKHCYRFLDIKYLFRVTYNMKTVYFHKENDGDKFQVKFLFEEESLNIKKNLILDRSVNETVDVFFNRLNNKLQNLFDKKNKKSKQDKSSEVAPVEFNPMLLLNNEPVQNNTVFQDLFSRNLDTLKLRILGSDYNVVMNAPIISNMTLPDNIRVGVPVYPKQFESQCTILEKCTFTWYKTELKSKTWVECGSGYVYYPTINDHCNLLKLECVPRNDTLTGPVCNVTSDYCVKKFDGVCAIEKRHQFTQTKTENDEFRVVSYNILADIYTNTKEAKTTLFTYCKPEILELGYRKDLILFELAGYNADLICLQEVEKKVFLNDLQPVFQGLGFDGIFCQKETIHEGSAFFYNKNKFRIKDAKQYVFANEILENRLLQDLKEKIKGNEKLIERVKNLPSQLQTGVLESLTTDNLLVIGNTHLYFHPDADHIRLLQGVVALTILHDMIEKLKKENPEKNVSLVFCGDFNSVPECGIYKFMNEGSVGSDHIDWKSNAEEAIENVSFTHSLQIKSAYGAPQYTNYTELFKACLDYIYYQTDHIELKQVVPLPSEEELSKHVAIPSEYFPSDHVSLVADFKWK